MTTETNTPSNTVIDANDPRFADRNTLTGEDTNRTKQLLSSVIETDDRFFYSAVFSSLCSSAAMQMAFMLLEQIKGTLPEPGDRLVAWERRLEQVVGLYGMSHEWAYEPHRPEAHDVVELILSRAETEASTLNAQEMVQVKFAARIKKVGFAELEQEFLAKKREAYEQDLSVSEQLVRKLQALFSVPQPGLYDPTDQEGLTTIERVEDRVSKWQKKNVDKIMEPGNYVTPTLLGTMELVPTIISDLRAHITATRRDRQASTNVFGAEGARMH